MTDGTRKPIKIAQGKFISFLSFLPVVVVLLVAVITSNTTIVDCATVRGTSSPTPSSVNIAAAVADDDESSEIGSSGNGLSSILSMFGGGAAATGNNNDEDDNSNRNNNNEGGNGRKRKSDTDAMIDRILSVVSRKSVQRGLSHNGLANQTEEELRDPNSKCDLVCIITYCRKQNLQSTDLIKCIHDETSEKSTLFKFDMTSIISYGLNLFFGCLVVLVLTCCKGRKRRSGKGGGVRRRGGRKNNDTIVMTRQD